MNQFECNLICAIYLIDFCSEKLAQIREQFLKLISVLVFSKFGWGCVSFCDFFAH